MFVFCQNLMSCACIEHLDFSYNIDLGELDIQPFQQIQHNFIGYTSLTEGPKLVAKEEEKRDFAVKIVLDHDYTYILLQYRQFRTNPLLLIL